MLRNWLIAFSLTLVLPGAAVRPAAPDTGTGAGAGAGAAAFEQLKALVGSWDAVSDGKKSTTTFELTAGGTVLVERYSNPALPSGGQMTTAYHLDGPDLVLTHHCIAGNQPTLRAVRFDPASREIQFEFVRATNLTSAAAGHMRRAKYTIDGRDRFTTEWEFFENGALKMLEREVFTRVRANTRGGE
jgi:hypothetical protein